MVIHDDQNPKDLWARFRFSIIGPLLAAPPEKRELQAVLAALAAKQWTHPVTGTPVSFATSTIERWFYAARNSRDPINAVRRRIRKDAGIQHSLSLPLCTAIRSQYNDHKSWSFQLHYDNIIALAKKNNELNPMPSYATIRRWIKAQGLTRIRRIHSRWSPGAERASQRLDNREVRSFEAEYVNGLWHADFHAGSLKVILPSGKWVTPRLLGFLDDHSRIACHIQWYIEETAESFDHGLSQAIQKRGLPRALLTDNGSPMIAQETQNGLLDLGIIHDTTLPYSPYQNGKQEVFWASIEGRLLPMLEGVDKLSLQMLNDSTQAWVELEYNRKLHSEINSSPIDRFLKSPSVARNSPSSEELRRAFTSKTSRLQRKSDGTITIEGIRFEIPSQYRILDRINVRYATWDLSSALLVDPNTNKILATILPLDKVKNADGRRRIINPASSIQPLAPSGVAPLLQELIADYAATGLPPAYIPKNIEMENHQ